jgi:hypothetical protein
MLKKAFQLGLFDPPNPLMNYGPERLGTLAHRQLALDGATQSVVLLKNDPVQSAALASEPKPLLPLAPSLKVAIVGPHFNASVDMLSNYHGANRLVYNHTPLLAMSRRGNVVSSAKGSELWQPGEGGFAEAVAAAARADVAIVFLGLHPQWFDSADDGDAREGEDLDRINITLPAVQLKLLQAINATGVPVVVVLINGGQVACRWVKANIPAVVEAWYPGEMGGDAIAAILYGDISPSGRLPYTMYDEDFTSRRPSIGDMSLSGQGGLTYQYYQGGHPSRHSLSTVCCFVMSSNPPLSHLQHVALL